MNSANANSNPGTKTGEANTDEANTGSGVPPAPPEAGHQAGGGESETQRLAAAARSEIETAKSLDGVNDRKAWVHEVAAWDLAYRVGFNHPELQEPPAEFAGSRTLRFGWAKGRTAAILNARCR